MNNKLAGTFLVCFAASLPFYGAGLDDAFSSSIADVVQLCNTSRWWKIENVADTHFEQSIAANELFSACVSCISNNWMSITNDWPAIRDDFEARVVLENIAGYAGADAFIGILGHVVGDAATNEISRNSAYNIAFAPRTPLWMYVPDHYADPAVSNMLVRLIAVASDNADRRILFESIISGEYKRWLDEAREAGAIEY